MKLKKNKLLIVAIVVVMLFIRSYDLKFKTPPSNAQINFYYKDNFLSQTRVSLLPANEKETIIVTHNKDSFGLLQRGSNRSLRHHANDYMIDGRFIKISNKEMHYVGIINSPDIVRLLVQDEKQNPLPVTFVNEVGEVSNDLLTRSDYKQYFYIVDVPHALFITIYDEHGQNLGMHINSTNE